MRAIFVLALFAVGCGGGGDDDQSGPVADPQAVSPVPGFATDEILVVASEANDRSLALLSIDPASGTLGYLPGSPIDLGVSISDVESLAADGARRRLFFGSDLTGAIAVAE